MLIAMDYWRRFQVMEFRKVDPAATLSILTTWRGLRSTLGVEHALRKGMVPLDLVPRVPTERARGQVQLSSSNYHHASLITAFFGFKNFQSDLIASVVVEFPKSFCLFYVRNGIDSCTPAHTN